MGYQGALVGHLEEREEQTALKAIQETVEIHKKIWMAKYGELAEMQLSKFVEK